MLMSKAKEDQFGKPLVRETLFMILLKIVGPSNCSKAPLLLLSSNYVIDSTLYLIISILTFVPRRLSDRSQSQVTVNIPTPLDELVVVCIVFDVINDTVHCNFKIHF